MTPEQWLSCVPEGDMAWDYMGSTMVHGMKFVEEGADCLRSVMAERDQLRAEVERLRARLASGIVTYERNGTIFHEVRPSWPTSHIDPLSPRDAAAVQSAEAQEIEDALSTPPNEGEKKNG